MAMLNNQMVIKLTMISLGPWLPFPVLGPIIAAKINTGRRVLRSAMSRPESLAFSFGSRMDKVGDMRIS